MDSATYNLPPRDGFIFLARAKQPLLLLFARPASPLVVAVISSTRDPANVSTQAELRIDEFRLCSSGSSGFHCGSTWLDKPPL